MDKNEAKEVLIEDDFTPMDAKDFNLWDYAESQLNLDGKSKGL